MVFGLSVAEFTAVHVIISLVAILAGVLFFITLMSGRWSGVLNVLFLVFTILTSVTGFMFPPKPIGPPFIFGVMSLIVLAVALVSIYGAKLAGPWRILYLVMALIAQWLNMVVLVVQSFQKIHDLTLLAPTGGEPPVLIAQGLVLAFILYSGWRTIRRPVRPMRA